MPKVSDEHKQRRREEILDGRPARLRAARLRGCDRRAARRGDRSLSRRDLQLLREQGGALRHPRQGSSARFVEIWLGGGLPRAARGRSHTRTPDWLSVQVEATRRVRTDAGFREQIAKLDEQARAQRRGSARTARTTVRDDMPIEVVAQFLGLLANGVAFARVTDDPMPDIDVLMTLSRRASRRAPLQQLGEAELLRVGVARTSPSARRPGRRSAASRGTGSRRPRHASGRRSSGPRCTRRARAPRRRTCRAGAAGTTSRSGC